MTRPGYDARDRMRRVIYVASGIGALVFGALLMSGSSGIMQQQSQLAGWYYWASLTVAVFLPASLIIVALLASAIVTRWIGRIAVIGFLVVEALWLPAMNVPTLANAGEPWIQGITALPSTLAAVSWRSGWTWLVPVSQGPIVVAIQHYSTGGPWVDAVLDGVGALLFCSVLHAIALAVMLAAAQQDEASARARGQASIEAARRTRESELGRIDAIVHDEIMSVLLTASRPDPPDTLSAQAEQALSSIAAITAPDRDAPVDYTPSEVVALLRATTGEATTEAEFNYRIVGEDGIPSAAAAALSEALGEALRNAVRHAGPEATVRVDVSVGDDGVTLVVSDDGEGFDLKDIDPARLGIRVSIIDRMASVPGGSGTVTSGRRKGTRVSLQWRRP